MGKTKLKARVVQLRKQGKTYSEIRKLLGISIPKSTLSYWCKDVTLPRVYQDRIRQMVLRNAEKGRAIALITNQIKRERYIKKVRARIKHLPNKLKEKDTAKLALAMLYLGEGSKQSGSLMFGNSNPFIIKLFLYLLRYCYQIDESKFRCTLQCRADQDIKKLQNFWSRITKIPLSQFYKARIDPRTIGKPSKKLNYKGVCRIDYFSADLFVELQQIAETIKDKV